MIKQVFATMVERCDWGVRSFAGLGRLTRGRRAARRADERHDGSAWAATGAG